MAMDHVFDLELALTMEDINSSGPEIKSSVSVSEDEEEISTTKKNVCMKKMMIPPASDYNKGGVVCTVCMDGFTSAGGGKQLVSCGHIYHENCITKWLSLHNSCPLCRSSIVSGDRNTTSLATHVTN